MPSIIGALSPKHLLVVKGSVSLIPYPRNQVEDVDDDDDISAMSWNERTDYIHSELECVRTDT